MVLFYRLTNYSCRGFDHVSSYMYMYIMTVICTCSTKFTYCTQCTDLQVFLYMIFVFCDESEDKEEQFTLTFPEQVQVTTEGDIETNLFSTFQVFTKRLMSMSPIRIHISRS